MRKVASVETYLGQSKCRTLLSLLTFSRSFYVSFCANEFILWHYLLSKETGGNRVLTILCFRFQFHFNFKNLWNLRNLHTNLEILQAFFFNLVEWAFGLLSTARCFMSYFSPSTVILAMSSHRTTARTLRYVSLASERCNHD